MTFSKVDLPLGRIYPPKYFLRNLHANEVERAKLTQRERKSVWSRQMKLGGCRFFGNMPPNGQHKRN
jgi:hypothetical protein